MKDGQMSSIDLVIAFSIIMAVIAISLVFIMRHLSAAATAAEIDEQLAFRTLLSEIKKNSTINFLDQSKMNLTAFDAFGRIAETNMTRFMRFFTEGSVFSPDICLFLMNASNQYVNVSGTRFAYGLVSNTPNYGTVPLAPCQSIIDSGLSPCMHYKDSQVFKKAVYLDMSYLDLYIVYCKP